MQPKIVLITGSEGFVGKTFRDHLQKANYTVLGCDLLDKPSAEDYFKCDLSDWASVVKLLEWCGNCHYIFHLAAAASVSKGIQNPTTFVRSNIEGTINLCEAIRLIRPQTRLIFVGSSEEYGIPKYLPIDESHPLNPVNPYAISKLAAEHYCHYMKSAFNLDIVCMRPFNHSGYGQQDSYVLSSFAKQIVAIEKGLSEPLLRVGNLSVRRDFCHVKDVVHAYLLAAEHAESGEIFNVCSGQSYAIADILESMVSYISSPIRIQKDINLLRPVDILEIYGSYAKTEKLLGWYPSRGIKDIMSDLLTYWRETL